MRKFTITTIIILSYIFTDNKVMAQQEAQFSHNMFNSMAFNPGYAGLNNAISAIAIARQQWVGFQDAENNSLNPETYSFTVDAPVSFLKGGLGLGFVQDQLGLETALGVKLTYAYHLDMDYGRLGIGGQIGFLDKRLDVGGFKPISEGDPALQGSGEETRMFIDGALGVFYQFDNQSWAGLSVSQLAQTRREVGNTPYQLRRNVYLTAGYPYALTNYPAFVVTPSLLLRTDFSTFQTDLNTIITYRERFWGGLSYRIQDAAVILLGLSIEQISIGYSYDITLSPIGRSARSWGSHEILVRYSFSLDIEKIQQTQRNVRFL